MQERKIMLSTVQDAKEFVTIAGTCDFDIDVTVGKNIMVDAKSIIGVLSLDLKNAVSVHYDGNNKAFEQFVERHEAMAHSAA